MAVSTKEVVATLRQGLGPVQADALAEWLEAVQTDLAAVTAKLDSDGGVTDTNYAALLTTTE